MIEKKSAKGDLDRKKTFYIMIGLFAVLTLTYASIELYATKDAPPIVAPIDEEIIMVEEDVLATDQTPPEPEQQQQQQQQQEVVIKIVDDNIKVEEFTFSSVEEDNSAVEEVVEIAHEIEEVEEAPPVRFAEEMCEFPGGMEALYKFLRDKLVYPEFPRQNNIQGTVVVEFVVGKTGKVSDVKVIVPLY